MVGMTFVVLCMTACGKHNSKDIHRETGGTVYICTGPHAKRYHANKYCVGLSSCSGAIQEKGLYEAENDGKTPCRMCVESGK